MRPSFPVPLISIRLREYLIIKFLTEGEAVQNSSHSSCFASRRIVSAHLPWNYPGAAVNKGWQAAEQERSEAWRIQVLTEKRQLRAGIICLRDSFDFMLQFDS
ncbi:hypothetical protein FGO68_gene7196 [Halteria grandinella]|uniref:Uncharacterized protein n=1 Tax=Halteria grandinella TaxID=5974 RepID=A0A8J8NHD5_HALGN|nr:hypothetical protein FGO68_gene7196 [Halteria grandinella]